MRKILFCLLIVFIPLLSLKSQEKTITGTIISGEDNLPLIGATVVVKGTTIGTITDFDGNYTIKVPEDAEILQFSFVGLLSQEVPIGDQTNISVTLQPDVLEMEEVVVTAIGIRREKKALGYAVQDVESDQISRSNNDNIVNSLTGKVAGVHINSSSGAAGSSTFIEIRGASSITRSNRPLFVIDGVPIEGGGGGYGTQGVATSDRVGDLNPDDIENISILKGGAASALYGMRAANGVVIITTKKGERTKKGQIHVNVHSSVSIKEITQVPELQEKYVQGSYYNADERFSDQYSRIGAPDAPYFYRQFSWGPDKDSLTYTWDPDYIPFDDVYRGSGDYDSMATYMEKWDPNGRVVYKPEYNGTTSIDENYFLYDPALSGGEIQTYNPYDFLQTGITFTNSISLSAGDEKRTYYMSYANTTEEGIIPNNTYTKNNFKLSASSDIFDNFSSTASINYMQNEGNRIQQGSNTSGLMLGLLRTPINFDNSFGYEFEDGQRHYQGNRTSGFDNPYWIVNNISYKDKMNRMIGNIELKYEPASWFNVMYKMGNDWYHQEIIDFFEIGSNESPYGSVQKVHTFNRNLEANLIFNFNKTFNDVLNTTFLIGQNIYQTNFTRLRGIASSISINGWDNLANSNDVTVREGSAKERSSAIYSDLGLSYRSMIFTNITAREEWSTTLPEGSNRLFYPSISLGFIFTELSGLKDNNILPYGKLRASYGITANTARKYSTYTRYARTGIGDGWTNGILFPFRETTGFTYDNEIGNDFLKPEKQKTLEIGADLRFIDNLFRIDIAYFKNINEDLLIPAPIASSTGFPTKYMNIGTMETKGIELTLGVTLVNSKSINWDLSVNFDNPKTMVTYLSNNNTNIDVIVDFPGFADPQIHAVLDEPYRMIWGSRWLRDEDDNLIINDDFNNLKVGYPIQDNNTGIIGNTQYDYKIGINNTISIKELTIYALLDIKQGGQMWNGTKGALYYFGRHKDTEMRDTETKVFEGRYGHYNNEGEIVHFNENGDEVAGLGAFNQLEVELDEYWYAVGPGSVFTGPVEDYVEDADWVRLKEVSVSYNFKNILNDKILRNLEVYFTGKNLFLITPYSGVDPETSLFGNDNAQGVDYFNMPGIKTYSCGIKLGF
ncbi:SusC/RagA family TonB-linked outer membrane protein [Bacteroidota bacterium]